MSFKPWDVDQVLMFPPSVKDFVPEGHVAHFIRDTVRETLDLKAIVERYQEEEGRKAYHPAMMVALLLYAYSQGIYSSRRIARACEERTDFMAVTGMDRPDFRTVNRFRARHLADLHGLFVQVVQLCARAGLVKLGHVALDGTKVRANASKRKAMSYGRMKDEERRLEAEIKSWLTKAEAADAAEDEEHGEDRRGDELPEWAKDKVQRLERIREAKAALEAEARAEVQQAQEGEEPRRKGHNPPNADGTPNDKAQRNFTDPESRIMKTGDGFQQCYNAQAVVDADSQVIVACDLDNRANDMQQLPAMVAQVEVNVGRQAKELSADAGYSSESNLEELERRGVRAYIAPGRLARDGSIGTGRRRPEPGTRRQRMWQRLRRGRFRSRYRLRKQTVEPVFGHVKEARGFRRFLLRGVAKVRAEWSLLCTVHNLLKLAAASA